jgi:hypothetical protein
MERYLCKYLGIGILAILFGAVGSKTIFAAPVDLPTAIKNVVTPTYEERTTVHEETATPSGATVSTTTTEEHRNVWDPETHKVNIAISGEGDFVDKRDLDVSGGEAEGQFYSGKISVPVYLFGQWDWYAAFGVARQLKIDANVAGSNVKYRINHGNDNYFWGAGANYTFLRIPEYGFSLFADGKYRRLLENQTEYARFTVNGTDSPFTANDDPQWQEWQGALGAALQFAHAVLYGGGKYSDVRINADVTSGGTRYALNNTESDQKFGGFAGVSLLANDMLSMDVEGRFGDELGYDAKLTLKF